MPFTCNAQLDRYWLNIYWNDMKNLEKRMLTVLSMYDWENLRGYLESSSWTANLKSRTYTAGHATYILRRTLTSRVVHIYTNDRQWLRASQLEIMQKSCLHGSTSFPSYSISLKSFCWPYGQFWSLRLIKEAVSGFRTDFGRDPNLTLQKQSKPALDLKEDSSFQYM